MSKNLNRNQDNKKVNVLIKSMFLGPKAENADMLLDLIREVFQDHIYWRRNFHPEDDILITEENKSDDIYKKNLDKLRQELFTLLGKLKADVPFFSPRYIGHMTADQSIPAIIGYIATMLYNPNNVTSEASPVTTNLELEIGKQLADMLGFSSDEGAWGHITSGGTVANFEGLWVARNIKMYPLAVYEFIKKSKNRKEFGSVKVLYKNKERTFNDIIKDNNKYWILLNLPIEEIIKIRGKLIDIQYEILQRPPEKRTGDKEPDLKKEAKKIIDEGIKEYLFSEKGWIDFAQKYKNTPLSKLKVLVPKTKHYSWAKAVEVLGIGRDRIVYIPLDDKYRVSTGSLKEILSKFNNRKIPILALVSVLGTTEEGALDPLSEINGIKDDFMKKGLNFYWHLDAAWGGYLCSMIKGPKNEKKYQSFITELKEQLKKILENYKSSKINIQNLDEILQNWSDSLFNTLKDVGNCDSITIDPHKLGFVPYPAGAVVFKYNETKNFTSCHAPYIFHETAGENAFIGRFILEGPKPGASATAVWLAHKMLPLNCDGYGDLIGETVKNAYVLYTALKGFKYLHIKVHPVFEPQSNLVCFVLNREGNTDLKLMNEITQHVYDQLSIKLNSGKEAEKLKYIISKTEFSYEEYGPGEGKIDKEIEIKESYGDNAVIKLLRELQVPDKNFVKEVDNNNKGPCDNKIVVLRMTVMDPWLLCVKNKGETYLQGFLDTLRTVIEQKQLKGLGLDYFEIKKESRSAGFVIIKSKSRILLNYNYKWIGMNFIGGRMEEQDKTIEDTIKREIKQELFSAGKTIDYKLEPVEENFRKCAISKRTKKLVEYNFSWFLLKTDLTEEKFMESISPEEFKYLKWIDISGEKIDSVVKDPENPENSLIISALVQYVFDENIINFNKVKNSFGS